MKNITIYNKEMSKAIDDKLWFTQFFNSEEYDSAIMCDLGCANGELIRHLTPMYPNRMFIGVDTSSEMINLAKQMQSDDNEYYVKYDGLLEISHDTPVFLIMSSVLHEIFNYQENSEMWIESMLDVFKADYILLRDMMYDDSINRYASDYQKVIDNLDVKQISEFEANFGSIKIQKNLVHLLLKYRFHENWDREVKENYFPISFNDLIKSFDKLGYTCIYRKQYILPFIQNKIKEDFGIDLKDNTHVNIIFKRNL